MTPAEARWVLLDLAQEARDVLWRAPLGETGRAEAFHLVADLERSVNRNLGSERVRKRDDRRAAPDAA
jgi:hypothetical protein